MDFHSREYYETRVYPGVSKHKELRVVTGEAALNYCGLSTTGNYMPCIITPHRELDNLQLPGVVKYFYLDDILPELETKQSPFSPNILLPSRERALVDCIRLDLRQIDEGLFLDSFVYYLRDDESTRLFSVAQLLHVPADKVQRWIKEAKDYARYI